MHAGLNLRQALAEALLLVLLVFDGLYNTLQLSFHLRQLRTILGCDLGRRRGLVGRSRSCCGRLIRCCDFLFQPVHISLCGRDVGIVGRVVGLEIIERLLRLGKLLLQRRSARSAGLSRIASAFLCPLSNDGLQVHAVLLQLVDGLRRSVYLRAHRGKQSHVALGLFRHLAKVRTLKCGKFGVLVV